MNKWSYVSVLCYAFQTRVVSYKSSAPKQFTYLGVKGIYFKLIDSYEDICPVHVGEEVNDEWRNWTSPRTITSIEMYQRLLTGMRNPESI